VRRAIPALLVLALAAAGCGAERGESVAFEVTEPGSFKTNRFADVGLSVSLPADGGVTKRDPPGVFRSSLGSAYVAVFAYRRKEPIPKNDGELRQAQRRLLRAIGERSDTWKLIRARRTRVDGARAIELLGDQTVSRGRLRGRSLHVYRGTGEYVIELEAPVGDFRAADERIFRQVLRSLKLDGRIRPDKQRYRVPKPRR
jgi:hypothetical protein